MTLCGIFREQDCVHGGFLGDLQKVTALLRPCRDALDEISVPEDGRCLLNDRTRRADFIGVMGKAREHLETIAKATARYLGVPESADPLSGAEAQADTPDKLQEGLAAIKEHVRMSERLIDEVVRVITAAQGRPGRFMGQPDGEVGVELVARTCRFLRDSLAIIESCGPLAPPLPSLGVTTDSQGASDLTGGQVAGGRLLEAIVREGVQPSWRLLATGKQFSGSADTVCLNPGNHVGTAWLSVPAGSNDPALGGTLRARLGSFGQRSPLGVVVESPGKFAEDVYTQLGMTEFQRRLAASCLVVLQTSHSSEGDLRGEPAWFKGWDGDSSPMFAFLPPEHIKSVLVPRSVYYEVKSILTDEVNALVTVVDLVEADSYSRPIFLRKDDQLFVPDYAGAIMKLVDQTINSGKGASLFFHAVRLPR